MSVTGIVFILLALYMMHKLAKFCWMYWLDNSLIYYTVKPTINSLAPATPFEFCHNNQQYKVFVTHDELQNLMPGTKQSRSNVYIDDKLVFMISRMRKMIFVNRSVDVNLQYSNDDIFKILRWARVYWRKQFHEKCGKEAGI